MDYDCPSRGRGPSKIRPRPEMNKGMAMGIEIANLNLGHRESGSRLSGRTVNHYSVHVCVKYSLYLFRVDCRCYFKGSLCTGDRDRSIRKRFLLCETYS